VSPGGGFGPVSDAGYGISYMFAGDYRLFFHISSKRSTPRTNSQKFMENLCKSFADMKCLFDE
jgi:carnitine O-palmitoyltransferase 1